MFSQEPRCIYRRNYLLNVICQLRFPEIPEIQNTFPKAFAESVFDLFPEYSLHREPAVPPISREPSSNHQFSSRDGMWHLNLTSKFLSLSCSRYTRWEDFARYLDKPLVALLSIYHPAIFDRVGLRYINAFEKTVSECGAYRNLIAPCYLGILAEADVAETAPSRSSVDAELAIGGGCRVKIHAGLGMVKNPLTQQQQPKFIFDQDLFLPGKVPVAYCAGALEDIHSQAYGIFRGAITDQLHAAMDPQKV